MTDTDLVSADDWSAEDEAAFAAMAQGEASAAEPPAAEAGGTAPAPEAATTAPAAPALPDDHVVDPDADNVDDQEVNKGKFVRHGAFHKEREARKALQAENAQMRDHLARADERLRLLTAAMQGRPAGTAPAAPEAAPAATVPNPEEDIFGYAKHLEQQIQELRSGQQKTAETLQAERQHETTVRSYQADAARFAQSEPAFGAAYQFLVENRAQELALNGLSPAEISKAIQADEFALAQSCLAAGVSPSERLFQMARLRGFSPKAPEPAAAPPAAPAETAAERQARVEAGAQTAGRSLSAAGGAPAVEMTLDRLLAMSDADFEAYCAKNPKRVDVLLGKAA